MDGGIAKTAKLYYFVLAVCDIGSLIVSHFLNFFLVFGLRFMTYGHLYGVSSQYPWACRMVSGSWFFFPHMINWTMFLLNIERVCVVMFPLRARKWFSISSNLYYLTFIGFLGVGMSIFLGKVSNILPTQILGANQCVLDNSDPSFPEFLTLFIVDLYMVPNILSLLCAIILIVIAKIGLAKRLILTHKFSSITQSAIDNNSIINHAATRTGNVNILSQIPGALVAAMLAFAHATFYLPDAFFVTIFFLTIGSYNIVVSAAMWTLFITFFVFSSMPSLINFIIYITRIPEFRSQFYRCICLTIKTK